MTQIMTFKGSRLRDGTPQVATADGKLDPSQYGGARFEWGFDGTDADTTALAILATFSGDITWATRYYKDFRRNVVSKLEEGGWILPLYDSDRGLIEGGRYRVLSRTDGWSVLVRGAESTDRQQVNKATPGTFGPPWILDRFLGTYPDPDPTLGRPRVHYYTLPRKDCSECSCPADRSDIKLVTYSIPFKTLDLGVVLWVRGAALRNPTDPASRREGRTQAYRRAMDAYAKIMACKNSDQRVETYIKINIESGARVYDSLSSLQNEERLTRAIEMAEYSDLYGPRSAKLKYYHDLFNNKHTDQLVRQWLAPPRLNQMFRQRGDGNFVYLGSSTCTPVRTTTPADRIEFLVVNVHARDQQAPAADPEIPEGFDTAFSGKANF